jgi:hypothetical protein
MAITREELLTMRDQEQAMTKAYNDFVDLVQKGRNYVHESNNIVSGKGWKEYREYSENYLRDALNDQLPKEIRNDDFHLKVPTGKNLDPEFVQAVKKLNSDIGQFRAYLKKQPMHVQYIDFTHSGFQNTLKDFAAMRNFQDYDVLLNINNIRSGVRE